MGINSKYIVVRRDGSLLVGFVRFIGVSCIEITADAYGNARRFASEIGAKEMVQRLNSQEYSSGNWEVLEILDD